MNYLKKREYHELSPNQPLSADAKSRAAEAERWTKPLSRQLMRQQVAILIRFCIGINERTVKRQASFLIMTALERGESRIFEVLYFLSREVDRFLIILALILIPAGLLDKWAWPIL